MIKIFVDKNESVAAIVEKVLVSPDTDIVVVVPKNSQLRKSVGNFELLKREAEASGKSLLIESVDDEVLSLAQGSGIDAMHSLFKRDQFHRSLSDIVPGDVGGGEALGPVTKKIGVKRVKTDKKGKSENTEELAPQEAAEAPAITYATPEAPPSEPPSIPAYPEEKKISPQVWESLAPDRVLDQGGPSRVNDAKPGKVRTGKTLRIAAGGAGVLAVIFAGGFVFVKFFSKVEIVLNFAKTPWEYEAPFVADKTVGSPSETKNLIPAELFTQKKNSVVLFDATGVTSTPQKASGRIVIYNAYSTAPQQLVATTRFAAPDGKILRLDKAVTVPGAKKDGSALVPSSIEATVTADKPGPEYNIGPIAKLTLPGFAGRPQYGAFYAEIKDALAGGSMGERVYATEQDIAAGKTKAADILKSALQTELRASIPDGIVILNEASVIEMTKLAADTATDAKGKFGIFGEAQLKALGFKEENLSDVLLGIARQEMPNGAFRALELSYAEIKPDFEKGKVSFLVKAKGTLVSDFDVERFKIDVQGKNLDAVKALVGSVDASVLVRLWPPFGFRTIPESPERVSVVIQ